jgi:hypothetical protein
MNIHIKCNDNIGLAILGTLAAIAATNTDPEQFSFVTDHKKERAKTEGDGKPADRARVHYMTVNMPAKSKDAKAVEAQIRELPPMTSKIYLQVKRLQDDGVPATKKRIQEFFGCAASTAERELGNLTRQGLLQAVPIINQAADSK